MEIGKYRGRIREKAGLSREELEVLLDLVLQEIGVLSVARYRHCLDDAMDALGDVDVKDVPFLAVALATEAAVWSDDKHFQQQNLVKHCTTEQLVQQETEE